MTEIQDLFKELSVNDDGGGEWISAKKTNQKKKKNIKIDNAPFSDLRAGVILKKDNKYLLVRGQDTDDSEGKWGHSKGHLEKEDNDDFIKTAIREIFEETEIKIKYEAFDKTNVFRDDKLILYIIDADIKKELINFPKEFRKPNREIKKIGWFTIDQIRQSLKDGKPLDKMNTSLRKWLKNQR
jgi:8-oxo-dGTP pyrophosphatase MutT (NUDIX family)